MNRLIVASAALVLIAAGARTVWPSVDADAVKVAAARAAIAHVVPSDSVRCTTNITSGTAFCSVQIGEAPPVELRCDIHVAHCEIIDGMFGAGI